MSSIGCYISVMRPVLKRDSLGFSVITLQDLLGAKGYDTRGLTDKFDATTETALKDFQRDYGLEQTGRLDENTRVALLSE